MGNDIQVRQLNKKTIIIIFILVSLGVVSFFLSKSGKETKASNILYELGYKSISDLKVYGVHKVENKDTRVQGYKHFVTFEDLSNNTKCQGFIFKDFKKKVKKDLTCK